MIFLPTEVADAYVIELEPHEDERGSFARTFCSREFRARGLVDRVAQCSLSSTARRGTLRGLHLQREPHSEAKLVRCVRGRVWDVAVDLRPQSDTYLDHVAVELSARNRRALYVPPGCAHGMQALEDDSELYYQMSAHYVSEAQDGVRWNDPAFDIEWPIEPPVLNERDRSFTDYAVQSP